MSDLHDCRMTSSVRDGARLTMKLILLAHILLALIISPALGGESLGTWLRILIGLILCVGLALSIVLRRPMIGCLAAGTYSVFVLAVAWSGATGSLPPFFIGSAVFAIAAAGSLHPSSSGGPHGSR